MKNHKKMSFFAKKKICSEAPGGRGVGGAGIGYEWPAVILGAAGLAKTTNTDHSFSQLAG